MGAGRILNRRQHRKVMASLKHMCNSGHDPVAFTGGSCPVCYGRTVTDFLWETWRELGTIVQKQPNRVSRGGTPW